ncbi:unnamed protein product, partial [Ectocarpus sp. 12 AP-2014]
PTVNDIRHRLYILNQAGVWSSVSLVKAHIGVVGNERADQLAKSFNSDDAVIEQLYAPLSFVRSQILAVADREWAQRWHDSPNGSGTKIFFPTLEHRRLVKSLPLNFVTTQFLTGHGKFRQYLHRFRLVGDPSCECGELQTSHHLLLDCPIFESVRCRLRRDVAQSIQEEDLVQEL